MVSEAPFPADTDLKFITYTGRPSPSAASKRVVRRHAMQYVGRQRRKDIEPRKRPLIVVDLEVPTDALVADALTLNPISDRPFGTPISEEGEHKPHSNHNLYDGANLRRENNRQLIVRPSAPRSRPVLSSNPTHPLDTRSNCETAFQAQKAISIPRLGGGGSDPFAQYPIKTNLRTKELINYRLSIIPTTELAQFFVGSLTIH
jgi:hypothetical protein